MEIIGRKLYTSNREKVNADKNKPKVCEIAHINFCSGVFFYFIWASFAIVRTILIAAKGIAIKFIPRDRRTISYSAKSLRIAIVAIGFRSRKTEKITDKHKKKTATTTNINGWSRISDCFEYIQIDSWTHFTEKWRFLRSHCDCDCHANKMDSSRPNKCQTNEYEYEYWVCWRLNRK